MRRAASALELRHVDDEAVAGLGAVRLRDGPGEAPGVGRASRHVAAGEVRPSPCAGAPDRDPPSSQERAHCSGLIGAFIGSPGVSGLPRERLCATQRANFSMAAGVTGVKKLTGLPSGSRNSSDRLPRHEVILRIHGQQSRSAPTFPPVSRTWTSTSTSTRTASPGPSQRRARTGRTSAGCASSYGWSGSTGCLGYSRPSTGRSSSSAPRNCATSSSRSPIASRPTPAEPDGYLRVAHAAGRPTATPNALSSPP